MVLWMRCVPKSLVSWDTSAQVTNERQAETDRPLLIRQLSSTNHAPSGRPSPGASAGRTSGCGWPAGCRSPARSPTRRATATRRTVVNQRRRAPGSGGSAARRAPQLRALVAPYTLHAPARCGLRRRPWPVPPRSRSHRSHTSPMDRERPRGRAVEDSPRSADTVMIPARITGMLFGPPTHQNRAGRQ